VSRPRFGEREKNRERVGRSGSLVAPYARPFGKGFLSDGFAVTSARCGFSFLRPLLGPLLVALSPVGRSDFDGVLLCIDFIALTPAGVVFEP
jgi:hypothetical protein